MPGRNHAPGEQFEKTLADMRLLSQLVEEIDKGIVTARGIDRHEATRALDEARKHIEIAQYFVSKAVRYARMEKSV